MKCTYCGSINLKVVNKRDTDNAVRRRRECIDCQKRFTTYERIEAPPLMVIKKGGERILFSREKVLRGILKATEKRPVTSEEIENVVDTIESRIRNKFDSEVQSKKIGEEIMKQLKKLDNVSYIRFASVYRDFQDIDDFKEAITKLSK